MSQNKKGYFQGTEQPTPKKKKYKSEKAIVDQSRFKTPFFRNYDLYETEGVDGPAKQGPGAGLYQNMDDYKSVSDFRKGKKKRNKDQYKADDAWIEDDGSLVHEIKKKKMARRLNLLQKITKTAIDFPIDDEIKDPVMSEDGGTYTGSVPMGGLLDEYLPFDFNRKPASDLDFGTDHENEAKVTNNVDDLMDEIINPKEPSLLGLPDEVLPNEDLDSDKTKSQRSQDYGTTDSGNILYNKLI